MPEPIKPLIPPDPERCQTEWLGGSFMTLGPRPTMRCESATTTIVFEKKADAHGRHGSMGMCDEHVRVFREQEPKRFKACTFWRQVTP